MVTPAKRGSFWRTGGGAFLVVAALSGGCSVLFHADATQCSSNADCTSRGTSFVGYTCHAGTCERPQCVASSDCSALDAALSSYVCDSYTCVKPTPVAEAGTDATDSGEAGIFCTKNSDCPPTNAQHREVACNVDTHMCLQLTTDDCPAVIGDYSDPSIPPPTFIGAFINIPGGLLTDPSYLNFLLALNEFTGPANGIPIGHSANPLRTPVAIGCDINGNLANAATHLIHDLQVPAIVSTLNSDGLSQLYLNYTSSANNNGNGVFVIDAYSDDPTLTTLQRPQGLLWHMLGQSGDSAPAFAAFVPMVEAYLRGPNAPQPLGSNPDGSMIPLKVATVTAQSSATNTLSSAVSKILTWNGGKSISDNGVNYMPVTLTDSTLNGTSLTDLQPTIMAAATELRNFQPNIVISFASDELYQVIQNVEIGYPAPAHLPFYLLGPYNMGDPNIAATVNTLPFKQTRAAGVGVASATNTSVLGGYESRFLMAYPSRTDALGYENDYDAMYFALYSLSYGKVPNPPSSYLATGMGKLINLGGASYDVGPGDQPQIFSALSGGGSIQLVGALGPPNFDIVTGSRIGAGDVYCIQLVDGGATSYDYDVLRLVNPDGGPPAGGGSAFTGSFPCYPGIQ